LKPSYFIPSNSLKKMDSTDKILLFLTELVQQNPLYGVYIVIGLLLFFVLLIWFIKSFFQRRDPLPKKLPDCIWHTTVKKLDRIYDGDTFYCYVRGHNPIDNKPVGIRIRGIDTAEMKDPDPKNQKKAQKAKELVSQELKNARTIHLYNVNLKDKYGRVLATVFCDRRDLAKILLEERLAKKYDGGKKEKW
jgi:endonuclease YncB( thermonuclease family)